MLRFGTYLLTIALSFGAGAAVTNHANAEDQHLAATATSAAFRDGLYLGKLTAKQGGRPHISAGRWSSESDRAAFAQGYQEGFQSKM
jgi:hypothetical protein